MLCSLAVCIIKKAIHTLTHARSVKEFVVALFSANLYPQKTKGQRGNIKWTTKFDKQ